MQEEFLWELFEDTGDPNIYLIYKNEYLRQDKHKKYRISKTNKKEKVSIATV